MATMSIIYHKFKLVFNSHNRILKNLIRIFEIKLLRTILCIKVFNENYYQMLSMRSIF